MQDIASTIVSTPTAIALAVGAAIVSFALPTSAEARPSTKDFTCSALRDVIRQRGAVVLNTKNANVYRRFVKDRTQCALTETTRGISVPTRDGQCRLRVCHEPLQRAVGR